jgi:5'-methylthioadenosine phosphorylase
LPETKYGKPSDEIIIAKHCGQYIAFLPRHGAKHALPPHKVPYKANLAALRSLGVEYVLGTCISGSLQKKIPPGSILIPDQFVNLTWGRDDEYKNDGVFVHLPMGEPYCRAVRRQILDASASVELEAIECGTVAVIQGPRFSTAAESRWLTDNGWDIVNMTQYPECYFARELGLCYGAIAAITDYDVGLHENLTIDPINMDVILPIFKQGIERTKRIVLAFVERSARASACKCAATVLKAYYEQTS